jgi:hypothetical protein
MPSYDTIQMFERPLSRVYKLLLDQIHQARQNSSVRLKVYKEPQRAVS